MARHNALAQMMAAMADHDDDDDDRHTSILPEAQIDALERVFRDYQLGVSRFSAGDIVTPKKNGAVKNAGTPHIVLEVRPDASCNMAYSERAQPGSNAYGRRHDMRVAHIDRDGDVACHWTESHEFEPYPA